MQTINKYLVLTTAGGIVAAGVIQRICVKMGTIRLACEHCTHRLPRGRNVVQAATLMSQMQKRSAQETARQRLQAYCETRLQLSRLKSINTSLMPTNLNLHPKDRELMVQMTYMEDWHHVCVMPVLVLVQVLLANGADRKAATVHLQV